LVDFANATKKVKADGTVEQYGLADNFAYAYSGQKYAIVQHGGQIFDDEWSYDETECVINSAVAVEALENQTDMVLVHNAAPTIEASEAIPEGLYRSGMSAGTFSWCDPGTYKPDEMKFEQTYIHFPFTKQRTQHVGADHHSVFKGSEKLEAAIAYAVAMTTDEDIETITAERMGVPAYRPKYFLDKMPETDLWTKNMYRVQLSRDDRFSEHPPSTENVEWSSKWWGGQVPLWFRTELSTKLQEVLIGEATMQEAMDALKALTDAEIAKKL
jgi:ABC-type glycerol-3-phosphate transport system substrate-binding protein